MSGLWAELRYEPAVALYAVNSVVAAVVAFGLHLTPTQTAAVTTIATGILALTAASLTRPVTVSAITGAVATVAAAGAAFGLHLTTGQIGAGVTVLSLLLSLVLRQAVTPAARLRDAALATPAPTGAVAG